MAAVSIRNLDDWVKERLQERAARHGRSMEAEIRVILTDAATEPEQPANLFLALHDRVRELGGVELEPPQRSAPARGADFSP